MRGRHLSGWRRPSRLVELNEGQRVAKTVFCFVTGLVCVLGAVWAMAWLLGGLACGVVSMGHLALFCFCVLMAVTFLDIAGREARRV